MNIQLEKYSLSPINQIVINERLLRAGELKKKVESTRNVFNEYVDVGKLVCSTFENLSQTFLSATDSDQSLKPIVNLLESFKTNMGYHYSFVQDKVIKPLSNFIEQIEKTEEQGVEAARQNDAYSKLLDSYATIHSKKKASKESMDKENKMLMQNWLAIQSNFKLIRSLDLVERKEKIEITSSVCIFFSNMIFFSSQILIYIYIL